MALSNEQAQAYIRRLLLSRMRILCDHGFFGLLLMHMVYGIDEGFPTAATDGRRIAFGPEFLESLSDKELDYVMMHEIMHVVLQHCLRDGDREHERFNIACDIVVNSNILLENNMDLNSITIAAEGAPSMHLAPDGKQGYEYTAEEVYEMLPSMPNRKKGAGGFAGAAQGRAEQKLGEARGKAGRSWDDHSRWGMLEEDDTLRNVWAQRVQDAAEAIRIRDPSNTRGLLPLFAQRLLDKLKKPQTDWRIILNEFVNEEVVDYSFSPPDRRFGDSPFFMPDFNGKEKEHPENILFMIDTSGSISDAMITAAYSEVKGAIDQFDGKLKGWLGFFDAAIIEPVPFSTVEEFLVIRPVGGGGTDFQIVFEYVQQHMQDDPPASIIMLTDGYAPFPAEKLANGIPVLWLLNNTAVDPPWGKVARIEVKDE